jgi:hypothetical protein
VRVASGSIVLKDVPPNSVVVGVPGRVIYQDGHKVEKPTKVEEAPDLELQAIKSLKEHVDAMEAEVTRLKQKLRLQNKEIESLRVKLGPEDGSSQEATVSSPDYPALTSDNLGSDPVDVFLQGSGI